jgi:hypothetical protein
MLAPWLVSDVIVAWRDQWSHLIDMNRHDRANRPGASNTARLEKNST